MDYIIEILGEIFTREFAVMTTAALPIIEVRGAIPVGISLGFTPLKSLVLGLIGSIAPAPIILFAIRPILNYFKTRDTFKRIVNKLTDRSLSKARNIKKYGAWGLLIFVAIPSPGTGVWTGSLIAALLNMRFKWAFPAIFTGNIIAGIIITILSYGITGLVGS